MVGLKKKMNVTWLGDREAACIFNDIRKDKENIFE
jgi:hypothetical protein